MKNDALDVLLRLADTRHDEALKRLGELLSACRSQEQKLALLRTYREEYERTLGDAAQRGVPAATLINFARFMEQLESALSRQDAQVCHSRDLAEDGRSQWRDARRARGAYEALLKRRAEHERLWRQRREQRDQDEIASRRTAHRHG